MWTETDEGREYIREISQDIVAELAPEELEFFDELIEEYFIDPTPPDLSDSEGDEQLGFGAGVVLATATPAAAAMASAVLTFILTEITKAVQKESTEVIKRTIKAIFNPEKQEKEGPSPLTKEQLAQVKRLARRQAREFGMDADLARKMADALVGRLALAS